LEDGLLHFLDWFQENSMPAHARIAVLLLGWYRRVRRLASCWSCRRRCGNVNLMRAQVEQCVFQGLEAGKL
jgi:hypothetical protein